MKTNALKKYARKQEIMMLTRHNGEQWLSLSGGIFPLRGWPDVNDEQLLTVLEVAKDKQDEYTVNVLPESSWHYSSLMDMMHDGEQYDVTLASVTIGSAKGAWVPAYTPAGTRFVSASALSVISEEASRREIIYRKAGTVEALVVMEGLIPAGVLICVSSWIDSQTAEELQDVAAVAGQIDRERMAEELNEGRQMRMEEMGE